MNKIVLGLIFFICLLVFVTSLRDVALICLIVSGLLIWKYNNYKKPECNDTGLMPLPDGDAEYMWREELKKLVLNIANLTLYDKKFFNSDTQQVNDCLLAESILTYIFSKNYYYINLLPGVIKELKPNERQNFIMYYNEFRGHTLRYGILSAYDEVALKINAKYASNAQDLLLDNIMILKEQNDIIIGKMNKEFIQSDRNFAIKELMKRGLIEDPALLGGDPTFRRHKE